MKTHKSTLVDQKRTWRSKSLLTFYLTNIATRVEYGYQVRSNASSLALEQASAVLLANAKSKSKKLISSCKSRTLPRLPLPRAPIPSNRLPPCKPSQIQPTLIHNLPPLHLPFSEFPHPRLFKQSSLNNPQSRNRKIMYQATMPMRKRALRKRPIEIRQKQRLDRAIGIMWFSAIPFKRDRVARSIVQVPEIVVDETVVHFEEDVEDVFWMLEEIISCVEGRETAEMCYP